MAWAETQPGRWQRPIGENESMIKMIGDTGRASGMDVWSISATASFTASVGPKPLTQALRDGWTALRFCHPSIAAVADGDTLNYRVPDAGQLRQWLEETFLVLHGGLRANQLLGTLPPRRFACCYHLEHTGEVLLHLSHWRTDGIGAFQLLGALFGATVEYCRMDPLQLPWGQEAARLVPSVEQALDLPVEPTEAIHAAAKQYLATLHHSRDGVAIPLQSATANAAATTTTPATRLPTLHFPAHQTAALLSACDRLGIRFEAALHASVTAAAFALALTGPDAATTNHPHHHHHHHHASTLRHSLRPHLPAPYNGVAGAAGLFTAGYFVRVPASSSFSSSQWLANARYYESEYARGATVDLVCSRRQYAREMQAVLRRRCPAGTPPPGPPPSGLDVSWVPGVQELVGSVSRGKSGGEDGEDQGEGGEEGGFSVRVDEVGISVDVLSRHVYVFAWLFDGRIGCRLAFNRELYDDGFADLVLGLVVENLTSNLEGVA